MTFAALYLLQRLKAPFPATKGSSGHRLLFRRSCLPRRLFVTTLTQTSRSRRSAYTISLAQGLIRLWYCQTAPAPFTRCSNPNTSSSIPSFTARVTLPSRDAPVIPSPPITSPSSPPIPAARFPHSPPASPFLRRMPPLSPVLRSQTHPRPRYPKASHSTSTSPASSVSPQTPPDAHGPGLVKVALAESSPVGAPVIPHGHGTISTSAKPKDRHTGSAPSTAHPQKPKTAHDQFAHATQEVCRI